MCDGNVPPADWRNKAKIESPDIKKAERAEQETKLGSVKILETQRAQSLGVWEEVSLLWPLDCKLSSNVIPVILGHS